MLIGIYGDSFAVDDKENGWINILRKKYNHRCTSFADSGTDIWFSYNHFIQNYQKFEYNIFVLTDLSREFNPNFFNKKQLDRLRVAKLKYSINIYSLHYEAIIDSIKIKHPRIKIINAMCGEHSANKMSNIQNLDHIKFFGEVCPLLEHPVLRACHMSFLQNEEFAFYVNEDILGKDILDITLNPDNVANYYTTSDELLSAGLKKKIFSN